MNYEIDTLNKNEVIFDEQIKEMTDSDLAEYLRSERVRSSAFNAYKHYDTKNEPSKIVYAFMGCLFGFFGLMCFATPLILSTREGGQVNHIVSALILSISFVSVAGVSLALYRASKQAYLMDLEEMDKASRLRGMYFAGVRRLFPQMVKPSEIESDAYRARPGESLMWICRSALFSYRDKIVSRSQSGGMLEQQSATIRHTEGVGTMAVTTKGINFISDDHASNIFMRWKDIAMIDTDGAMLVIQPYTGKVRYFLSDGSGVDPRADPHALRLYIESLRDRIGE